MRATRAGLAARACRPFLREGHGGSTGRASNSRSEAVPYKNFRQFISMQ